MTRQNRTPAPNSEREFQKQLEKGLKQTMEVTLKVEGMMCPKCENRTKKALEAVAGVEQAVVSHTAGTAVVTGNELNPAALKEAVEQAGYKVVG